MPASGSTAGRASTIERENYTNNAAWIDSLSGETGASGAPLAVANGLAVTGTASVTGVSTLTGGLAPNKGYPGTSHPASSSLDAHLTSATVAGNDTAGTITLVFDGTGSSASVALCTITFANATLYSVAPVVTVTNLTQGAASTTLYAGSFGVSAVSATTFILRNGVSASTASSTYVVGYSVTGLG